MRHISFDESSVLREFARIAEEKGLIKTAQDVPQARGDITDAPPPGESAGITEIETGYKDESGQRYAPRAGDKPASAASVLAQGQAGPALTLAAKGAAGAKLTKNPGKAAQTTLNELYAFAKTYKGRDGLDPLVGAVSEYLVTLGVPSKMVQAEMGKVAKYFDQMGGGRSDSLAPPADDGMTASASKDDASSLYDVSKETGEQLVEKAHPGGGTRTELTHSKTDENLVETIVEQQAKDVEVANSVPKGVHATLTNLADKLDKMGYISAADKVDKIISTAGPADDAGMAAQIGKSMTNFPAASGGGAGRAPGAIMSRVGPAAARAGGAAARGVGMAAGLGMAALPWLAGGAAVAGAGLAGYFLYKDLAAAETTLDGVIDRLGDLDPNPQAAPVVQQWITTLQGLKPNLKIPQASTDSETQKGIAQQRLQGLTQVAQSLTALQKQYMSDIKPNLTDWGMDASQAEKVIINAARAAWASVDQVKSKMPKVEEAAAKQKEVEKTEGEGEGSVGKPEKKRKGRDPKVRKWQQDYNKILGLKRGDPKFLAPDGILGRNTRGAGYPKLPTAPAAGEAKKEEGAGVPPPPDAPPPTRKDRQNMYQESLNLLDKRYHQFKGKKRISVDDQWDGVRQKVWEMAKAGKHTPEMIAEMFDVTKMKELRRGPSGLAPPAMPKPRMSRPTG